MAEMVKDDLLLDVTAVGVMQGAAATRPDDAARRCSFACFAAFFIRLDLLGHAAFSPDLLLVIRRLLPKLLPEVRPSSSSQAAPADCLAFVGEKSLSQEDAGEELKEVGNGIERRGGGGGGWRRGVGSRGGE